MARKSVGITALAFAGAIAVGTAYAGMGSHVEIVLDPFADASVIEPSLEPVFLPTLAEPVIQVPVRPPFRPPIRSPFTP